MAISLLLHAVVVVALLLELREQLPEAEAAAISVELVPPHEPEEPEPPKPETAENQAPEPPPQPEEEPPSGEELAALPPLPVLRPVYEFAEDDTGPQSDSDDVSEGESTEPEPEQPKPQADAAQEQESAGAEPSQGSETEVAETPDEPAQELPNASETLLETERNDDVEAAPPESGSAGAIALVTPTPKPEQDPPAADGDQAEVPAAMTPAEHLYSDAILNDPTFRTAMAGLPRSRRASLLCMTEMRDQLRAASRPPEVLPSYRLPAGTVLEPRRAAFRTQGQWFDLAFRCEVDQQVTRVLKFSYRIGDAIPRAQWGQRGFPNL